MLQQSVGKVPIEPAWWVRSGRWSPLSASGRSTQIRFCRLRNPRFRCTLDTRASSGVPVHLDQAMAAHISVLIVFLSSLVYLTLQFDLSYPGHTSPNPVIPVLPDRTNQNVSLPSPAVKGWIKRKLGMKPHKKSRRPKELLLRRVKKLLPKKNTDQRRKQKVTNDTIGGYPSLAESLNKTLLLKNGARDRGSRFLSLFTVVRFVIIPFLCPFAHFKRSRFQNEMCLTQKNNNGTCYTAQDCLAKGGSPQGSCASGFGVCCYFEYMCSAHTMENGTYFVNPATPQSMCHLMITRINNDICQIRLELDVFEIAGPNEKVTKNLQNLVQCSRKMK